MTTIYNIKSAFDKDNSPYLLVELRGLSTDEKPTKIENDTIEHGSVFIEIDTGDVYLYDLENETWYNLNGQEEQEEQEEQQEEQQNEGGE